MTKPEWTKLNRRLAIVTLAAASVAALSVSSASATAPPSGPAAWPASAPVDAWASGHGDGGHNHFNPGETSITPADVGSLKQAWSVDDVPAEDEPVIADGVAYLPGPVLSSSNPVPTIRAVDVRTGALKWQVFQTVSANRGMAVFGGNLYVFGDAQPRGGVSAISLATHQVLWTSYVSGPVQAIRNPQAIYDFASDAGRLYLYSSAGNVDAFDAVTGAHLWTQDAALVDGEYTPVSGTLLAADGRVAYRYLDTVSHQVVYAVRDGATNKVLWTLPNDGGYAQSVGAGRLYVAYLGNVTEVQSYPLAGCGAATCQPTWRSPIALPPNTTTDDVLAGLSGADASSVVLGVTTSGYGAVSVLNAVTGATIWSDHPYVSGTGVLDVPLARAGNVVYAFADAKLLAYDLACRTSCTPTVVAPFDAANDFPNAQVSIADGTVVVQEQEAGDVRAFRPTSPAPPVRPAASAVYIASSRAGSAVYVNGLTKQVTAAGVLTSTGGRTAYLQRFLNGQWQTMLARTSNSHGQLVVGFVQRSMLQYRWVVVLTAVAGGAYSVATVR